MRWHLVGTYWVFKWNLTENIIYPPQFFSISHMKEQSHREVSNLPEITWLRCQNWGPTQAISSLNFTIIISQLLMEKNTLFSSQSLHKTKHGVIMVDQEPDYYVDLSSITQISPGAPGFVDKLLFPKPISSPSGGAFISLQLGYACQSALGGNRWKLPQDHRGSAGHVPQSPNSCDSTPPRLCHPQASSLWWQSSPCPLVSHFLLLSVIFEPWEGQTGLTPICLILFFPVYQDFYLLRAYCVPDTISGNWHALCHLILSATLNCPLRFMKKVGLRGLK